MEILAQSHQHGDASMEILAQSHQHGVTSIEYLPKSEVQGAKCTELSASPPHQERQQLAEVLNVKSFSVVASDIIIHDGILPLLIYGECHASRLGRLTRGCGVPIRITSAARASSLALVRRRLQEPPALEK